jgi:uncharacterized protein YodC (DUF2158 family)
MDRKFKTGDIVRLKSGGPAMTVLEYEVWQDVIGSLIGTAKPSHDTGLVNCQWFKDDEIKKAKFHQDMLDLV